MGTIYVYHHNDHDGIVAAGVLYWRLKDVLNYVPSQTIKFIMIDYDKDLNFDNIDFTKGDCVYFLDYSFTSDHNKKEFKKLLDRRKMSYDVQWIDHHKSSIGVFDDLNISGIRNTRLCAAALTYLYFDPMLDVYQITSMVPSTFFHNSKKIPLFLKLIDDYDCWKGLYSTTNDFHYGLNISSPTDPIIQQLLDNKEFSDTNDKINKIVKRGEMIREYLKFEDKTYHVDMYGFEFTLPEEHGGYKCFCMNRKGNSIMFGDKIKLYDAVIPFYYINGKWKYSIFTEKDDVNCIKVAKSYGGGGHLKAAGWVIPELIFN